MIMIKYIMKKRRVIGFIFLLAFISGKISAYTDRDLLQQSTDLAKVKAALKMSQQWVSHPSYTDRSGWDDFLKGHKNTFIEQGEKLLNYEWKVVKATDYIEFERSGDRNIMQNPFGSNNKAIADLLLAELAEGKGRFIDQLINGVFHACEMTSWALSAHLVSAQHTKRALPDYKDQVIDLTSGDLSSLLAWTYYFLHEEFDKVNPVIAERLRHELQVRTLDPYMNEDRFWWMAFDYKPGMMINNWNPWCNFNVLQCFLLLENDRDKLAEAVYRTMISVDRFINYTHADGACEEGPSYWGHAAGKLYDYLQILYDGTGGEISIFKDPLIKNMGEYIARSYVGKGWVVNFADASAKGGGDAPLIYRYGKAVNSELMMNYAGFRNQNAPENRLTAGIDFFRTLQNIKYTNELNQRIVADYVSPDYTWYPETEFCYITNKNGFFLATKGGYNNESHNHNDIGTFSLYLNSTPVFIDAGVGTYTRQTFSNERYSIWTMQSDYHNLPKINGVSQAFGGEYKAKNVMFNVGKKSFSLDIAGAYPNADVKQWVRSYTLGKNSLEIEDEFILDKIVNENQINFLSWGNISIKLPGEIHIDINGEKVALIYDHNIFELAIETISLSDPRLSDVWGSQVYRISLNARKMELKGKYTYTIKKIK